MTTKIGLSDRIKKNGSVDSVWLEILSLVSKHGALNMGLGCPDFRPPEHVLQALSETAVGANYMNNHYTRAYGHTRLVNVLAKLYSITLRRDINPLNNVSVHVGAFEALYCTFMGLVNLGDEVILLEPFYEPYKDMIELVGAVPVYVPLKQVTTEAYKSADWMLDIQALKTVFTCRTKAIVVNNPSNPLGKVFTYEELMQIQKLCLRYDVLCIADEVYEWLVYGEKRHIRMATIPGMWDRTITIGSGGKTFSVTGWKVGWAIGPESLLNGLKAIHHIVLRTNPTPTQEAIAIAFENEVARLQSSECYFNTFSKELEEKRDILCHSLNQAGIKTIKPDGGYFILADISCIDTHGGIQIGTGKAYDYLFVKWAIKEWKLCVMPVSMCYSDENKHLGEKYVRICFVKKDETLQKTGNIFQKWKWNEQITTKSFSFPSHNSTDSNALV